MSTITVTNLGKAYKQYPTRWGRLAEWIFPFAKPRHTLKWVMQGVSFTVNPGEAVGIIGINGAGKSTLLKMITGTTQPTTGNVSITGRVAALLELGMGFHPDFTGRQNVYMAGQLSGMSVEEITHLMPEIEAFAEIGDYIDMPVRIYSSGMQVRLAFSVATAKMPEILIIDEALSVGDAYFQHKCVGKIREFSEQGATILFVSHDPGAIKNICNRAILINGGILEYVGEPDDVLDYYSALLAKGSKSLDLIDKPEEDSGGIRSGNGKLSIAAVELSINGVMVYHISPGNELCINVKVQILEPIGEFCIGISIRDRYGNVMVGTNTELLKKNLHAVTESKLLLTQFYFPSLCIGPGSYSVSIALHDPYSHIVSNYDWWDKAAFFEVVGSPSDEVVGLCYMPVTFSLLDSVPHE
jgi:lipopolysaccharide transport system ATP-binding protein